MFSKTKIIAKVLGVILVFAIVAGLGGMVASDNRPPIGDAPPINDTKMIESSAQSQNQEPRTYAVTAQSVEAIDSTQLAQYGEVGTQAGTRIEVTMTPTAAADVKNISWVTSVRKEVHPQSIAIPGSSNGSSLGIESIHDNGTNGKGVKVGIIDSGFEINNPAIASNVALTKSFRQTQGAQDHGTSVAETVVRTAPGSQLYIASIATGTDDEAAIDYLSDQGVDIIVHSIGFPTVEDDGDHFLTDNIESATKNGSLFVTSAGNDAQLHWEGNFRDTDGDNIHEWDTNGDELNCLPNCSKEYSGDITVYLRWDDQHKQSQYRLALYDPVKGEYTKLGSDRVFTTPTGTQYTVLNTTVTSRPVDLVVAHTGGSADDEIEIVVAGPNRMEQNVPNSSIGAPGDVPQAFTAAAYKRGINDRSTQLASYSSRGPTDDGRTGIDAAGYTNIRLTNGFYKGPFGGTSAAAPYIGGVAALIEQNQPGDPSAGEVTAMLKSSSDDILIQGNDTASGSGVINASDAIVNHNDPPAVTVDKNQQTVARGGTTTYDIILTDAPNGVSTYSYSISSGNTVTAKFTDFTFGGTPSSSTTQLHYGKKNSTLSVTGGLAGIAAGSNVTLGTVTITGNATGSTTLGLSVTTLLDRNNGQINAGVTNGTISVSSGPGVLPRQSQPPSDPDSDGVYEDLNGDSSADLRDLQPFFNLVRPSASPPNTPSFFDVNGDGSADLRDLQPFFNEVRP